MEVLDQSQGEFLYLLAFLYMQQAKYEMALPLFRLLRLHTARDLKVALALASCLHQAKRQDEGLKVLQSINEDALTPEQKVGYYYIYSKLLWDLKQKDLSREMLHKYLKLRQIKQ